MIIDEMELNTKQLFNTETELINSIIKYRENGILVKTYVKEIENILSKNTSDLVYRFNIIYNNTDTINRYFTMIQIRAEKGEDILKLHEYYYFLDFIDKNLNIIKINYMINRINILLSNYYINKLKEERIKELINLYLNVYLKENKKEIENIYAYKTLNDKALEFVLDVAEQLNLKINQAI